MDLNRKRITLVLLLVFALVLGACAPSSQKGTNQKIEEETTSSEEGKADVQKADEADQTSEADPDAFSQVDSLKNLKGWRFQGMDLDRNSVNQEILKGKKLTMVNIWATYCGYCLDEMPFFQKFQEEYGDQGFQVVGILLDVIDEQETNVQEAKQILEKTGVKYQQIRANQGLYDQILSDVVGVPTTFFVDENGDRVGEILIGGKPEETFRGLIESYLNN